MEKGKQRIKGIKNKRYREIIYICNKNKLEFFTSTDIKKHYNKIEQSGIYKNLINMEKDSLLILVNNKPLTYALNEPAIKQYIKNLKEELNKHILVYNNKIKELGYN